MRKLRVVLLSAAAAAALRARVRGPADRRPDRGGRERPASARARRGRPDLVARRADEVLRRPRREHRRHPGFEDRVGEGLRPRRRRMRISPSPPRRSSRRARSASPSRPWQRSSLVEDGKLKLDADINAYLKSWKVPGNEHTAKTPVTLEELLSHTAGLTVHGFPGYAAGAPLPTVPQVLDGAPPANTAPVRVDLDPGTQYRYSGGGYTIAQLAMVDVTGQAFPALLQRLVLGPLGMKESTFDQPLPASLVSSAAAGYSGDGKPVQGKRHVYPEMAAAGLWTTPSDLARFAIGIQKMLAGGKGPLSKAMAENMVKPRRDDYALGLGIRDEGETKYFEHGGADEGFQAQLTASENRGYGAVIMTNSDKGYLLMPEIMRVDRGGLLLGGLPDRGDPHREALRRRARDLRRQVPAGRGHDARRRALRRRPRGQGPPRRRLHARSRVEAVVRAPGRGDALHVRAPGGRRGPAHGLRRRRAPRRRPASAPGMRVPSEDLADGKYDEALAGYRKLLAANPKDSAVAETRFNQLGYDGAAEEGLREGRSRSFASTRSCTPTRPTPTTASARPSKRAATRPGRSRCTRSASRWPRSRATSIRTVRRRAHSQERLKALGAS